MHFELSASFLAASISEIHTRYWPPSKLANLIASFISPAGSKGGLPTCIKERLKKLRAQNRPEIKSEPPKPPGGPGQVKPIK